MIRTHFDLKADYLRRLGCRGSTGPYLQGQDEDATMLDYLGDRNLVPGRLLRVREVRALDGVVVVEDEEAEAYALGEPLARSNFVRSEP